MFIAPQPNNLVRVPSGATYIALLKEPKNLVSHRSYKYCAPDGAQAEPYCRLVMSAALKPSTVRDQVSTEEWQARVDLAAAYRLVALYGWGRPILPPISARGPGAEPHLLLNPSGLLFGQGTGASLGEDDPGRR